MVGIRGRNKLKLSFQTKQLSEERRECLTSGGSVPRFRDLSLKEVKHNHSVALCEGGIVFFLFVLSSYHVSWLQPPLGPLLPRPDPLLPALFPRSTAPLFAFRNEQASEWTEHRITGCNETRHKLSSQGWKRQPNRRKGVLTRGPESRQNSQRHSHSRC